MQVFPIQPNGPLGEERLAFILEGHPEFPFSSDKVLFVQETLNRVLPTQLARAQRANLRLGFDPNPLSFAPNPLRYLGNAFQASVERDREKEENILNSLLGGAGVGVFPLPEER